MASSHSISTRRSDPVLGLLRRYRDTGDVNARDEAVTRLMPLVTSVCRRYEGRAEWDDLMQVACLGLVKALDRFDPDRGVALSSFVVPTVSGELRRYFRDRMWTVRPPRDLHERSLLVGRTVGELTARHGRSPVPAVVAEHLGLTEEEVVEALVARQAYEADSLDAPARTGTDDDGRATLGDLIGGDDDGLGDAESRAVLASLLAELKPRDREILRLRFEQDLTQSEIAKQVGLSQMQISRIIRAALERMRASAEAL